MTLYTQSGCHLCAQAEAVLDLYGAACERVDVAACTVDQLAEYHFRADSGELPLLVDDSGCVFTGQAAVYRVEEVARG